MMTSQESAVIQKARELCQAIVEEPSFAEIRKSIDTFMSNETVQEQYQELTELGTMLRQKQQMGVEAPDAEVESFETKRQAFLNDPVASAFLDAQENIHGVKETVAKYVTRTFELGRLPDEEDFEGCGCGSGCGCH